MSQALAAPARRGAGSLPPRPDGLRSTQFRRSERDNEVPCRFAAVVHQRGEGVLVFDVDEAHAVVELDVADHERREEVGGRAAVGQPAGSRLGSGSPSSAASIVAARPAIGRKRESLSSQAPSARWRSRASGTRRRAPAPDRPTTRPVRIARRRQNWRSPAGRLGLGVPIALGLRARPSDELSGRVARPPRTRFIRVDWEGHREPEILNTTASTAYGLAASGAARERRISPCAPRAPRVAHDRALRGARRELSRADATRSSAASGGRDSP
jgi:hypothetical protein